MNRQNITTDSRAAFYLKARGQGLTAAAAWGRAASMKARAAELAAAWDAAKAALAVAWEAEGKKEPRRYDPAGQELARLRGEERAASRAYFNAWGYVASDSRAYWGNWIQESGHYFAQCPAAMFRDVVTAEDVDSRLPGGWFDNPHGESARDGSGLVIPVVAQLAGKAGQVRYVAGYKYGSQDSGGMTFDTSRIFESHGEDMESARIEAARAANELAESKAEEAREYATAWEAGRQWRELKEEEEAARAAALAVLAERRPAKGAGAFPALCDALRATISGHVATISGNRAKREELAAGDSPDSYFYPDKEARAAFCEGAELAGFPV